MNHFKRFLSDPAVNVLSFVVMFVDLSTYTDGFVHTCGCKQLDSDSS